MASLNLANCFLEPVGKVDNPPGSLLIFSSDVNASEQETRKNAEHVSKAFENRVVTPFHNPITSSELHNSDLQKKLSELFAKYIKQQIEHFRSLKCNTQAIRIQLFVHGHSATLTAQTLPLLDIEEKQLVEIYAFGATRVVAKSCRLARNYVHLGDHEQLSQEGFCLMDYLKIKQRLLPNKQLETVISEEAYHDLYFSLSPFTISSTENTEVKKKKFETFFIKNDSSKMDEDLLNDSDFKKRVTHYRSLLSNYDIHLLPDIRGQTRKVASFGELGTFMGIKNPLVLEAYPFSNYIYLLAEISKN